MKSILILMLLSPIFGFSQDLSKKELRKSRPLYLNIATGLSSSTYRDFATSPLIYEGTPISIDLSRMRSDLKRESEFGASYFFGNYKTTFNDHSSESNVNTIALFYSQLYQLRSFNSKRLNLKVGGLLNATTNLRVNEKLGNNGLGLEIIPTLFASAKMELDISRKEKIRNLAFRLNVGLLNNSYRNGYVYQSQSPILNDDNLIAGHQLNVLSGFRMSTAVDYKVLLKNKNAIQLSYVWDAYQTGGEFEALEMASHTFKITFMFNTNNK